MRSPYLRKYLTARPDLLTDRERAVGAHLADGLTPAQVAERLGITRYMVANDRRQLYRKLQLRGMVDLAHYAIRVGWVGVHGRRGPTVRKPGPPASTDGAKLGR